MIRKRVLTYKQTGINYEAMDPLKRLAQSEGKKTAKNLSASALKEFSKSRGESAYVVESGSQYLAFVEECLGTKTLVAEKMRKITKKTYYDALAQDTVAMMVNDLVSVGARPSVVLAYWAMGSDDCFKDKAQMEDLVRGWKQACDMAGAAWGGGESPTLAGVLQKNAVDLAGACFGVINPKKRLIIGKKLQEGDRIILFESSGIHANGISLARKIAAKLSKGYATKLPDGSLYGEALLKPTIIYARLIQNLFAAGVDIHYISNITGHGWRKIMRHPAEYTYRIHIVPPVPAVLQFMVRRGPVDEREAYGNLNMGAGYAIIVPKQDVKKVLQISKKNKIQAYDAGSLKSGPKRIIIEPKGIVFEGASLKVRG